MHIHGECFVNKDSKISNRLREWYVVVRYGHRSKTESDLTYLGGTNVGSLVTQCPKSAFPRVSRDESSANGVSNFLVVYVQS